MITLTHVKKVFDGHTAVADISLTVKPGEIVGLLGPNGAGKTTTIRMMAGVLPPSGGTIRINNKTFVDHEYELKSKIGYLPENNPLYDDLTVEEHLMFWGKMKGLSGSTLKDAIGFAVLNTGIGDVFYRLIGELSKGYRQRVGLSQAILSRPEILLLDEPTEGLDPNQRREIQQLLGELKKDRTVIVSSHVLSEISKLASRIVIIHQGLVVGDNTPKNLTKRTDKKQVIELELKGKSLLTQLKKLKGVNKVMKVSGDTYSIEADGKSDLRPNIFKLANQQKWTLLSVRQIDRQLEDVFTELTGENK
jgi:ABC-2 type transport system ATP-binding protein